MKKYILYILVTGLCFISFSNRAFSKADPALGDSNVNPAPITSPTGITVSVKVINNGTAINNSAVQIILSLAELAPASNFNIATDMTGGAAALFTWTYDPNNATFTGVLNQNLPQFYGDYLYIGNLVSTGTSPMSSPNNGFNSNITAPSAYNSNQNNDNASAYTYSNAVLPVTISSFTGINNNCKANLKWQTETELNSDHYDIQQSVNGLDFYTVGSVKSSNLANGSKYEGSYSQSAELAYYRLKAVDKDGTFKYSEIINIKMSCIVGNSISVYPNPVIDIVNIANLPVASNVTVTGVEGQLFLKSESVGSQLLINMSKYASGTYILQVQSATGVISTTKLLKK